MVTIAGDDGAGTDVVAKLTPRKNAVDDNQWQSIIDASAERFLRHVASRRGWPDDDLHAVAERSGEGKLMTAAEAKTRGLIDQVVEEGSMDPDTLPDVVPAEDEKSIDEVVVELREAVADHDRRIAELEAIVENLRREKDDEEADLAEETAEGEDLSEEEKKKEEEMQAKCDRPRAASRQLAAMQRQIASMQKTQRDEVIARLRAEGRIAASEVDLARNTYDTNRKLFDRVYGKPAAMSTVTRISSAESATLKAKPSNPTEAAWAEVAASGGKISFIEAYHKAGGR